MIYRNSKGKFISKDEWLSLQPKENKKTMNNSRRRKHTQTAELNAPQEQVTSKSEIAEGTQVVEVGSDFDLDAYKERVVAFEKYMEEYVNKPIAKEEEVEEEPTKTPGFFATWFKKWIF
jgi:hypothetical protein